ncbi:protein containing Tetratricopeptide repeat (TPR) domain [Sulfurimonas gotlandica GD1]|jgi:TPR repeat protein|uniref:beta-lactamase n=1 Tax=Sulfurimonas gotlandica (strain DSM 19862 / JCM 16533 / GD1) TaxID=929558 RepID=B6BGR3_SULGG|nr:tetratricopeptide repeat protein [Sulfurimonas gotlandica]EDZ62918.1 Sel1 repeat family protein [Sulfurimonas gotlandica GD1]EHP29694.1 protein containing Tetratricopeptide repeat (TPR) domain [Sulfurimonas gotlandica GD1]
MIKIIISIAIFLSANLIANQKFEQSCNEGKMQYCIELGMLYYNGEGVKKDIKKSQIFFKKACKNRVSRGCYYLGYTFLRGGEGVEKSNRKAMLSFGRGCNIGSERSCVQYHKLKSKGH